jgi:hypothetical protein
MPFPRVETYRVRYEPRRRGPSWVACLEQVIVRGRGRSKTFSFRCTWDASEDTFCSLLQDAGVQAAEWALRRCETNTAPVIAKTAPVIVIGAVLAITGRSDVAKPTPRL